jgi:hypothetical protein
MNLIEASKAAIKRSITKGTKRPVSKTKPSSKKK